MTGRARTGVAVGAVVISAVLAASLWLVFTGRSPDPGSGTVTAEHAGSLRPIPPAPLAPRVRTHAAWSGSELLVWSGAAAHGASPDETDEAFQTLADGAAFRPDDGSWRTLPGAPIAGRVGAATVWADDRLLVWGGFAGPDTALDDGAMYLPDEDRWLLLPPAPIRGRGDVTAVWTGDEVLIVGGAQRPGRPGRVAGVQRDGAAYDPAADRWRVLPPIPEGVWPLRDRGILPIRERFAGTWTGDSLFIWGRDVAQFRPGTDDWTRTSAPPADIRISGAVVAVRLGSTVAVIGVANRADPDSFGITFDTASDRFGSVPPVVEHPMNTPRQIVAGDGQVVVLLTDPAVAAAWRRGEGAWQSLPPDLVRGTEAAAVWTGMELLVWGGSNGAGPRADGLAWRP